ncbi:MAG: V-type ATP synthase subunit F [Synergistaceae bacterium]|nr:V-type ATP synthase subunit F [Synergistaceae bacterium]
MATSKAKISPMAAMGSYDLVMPFQAIGMETVVINAENKNSVPQLLSKYVRGQYAILFLEESLFEEFRQDADSINESESLSVVPIPNQAGSLGVGIASIRDSAERAVGMDIFGVK